jgi:peptidylprolyl isomerase
MIDFKLLSYLFLKKPNKLQTCKENCPPHPNQLIFQHSTYTMTKLPLLELLAVLLFTQQQVCAFVPSSSSSHTRRTSFVSAAQQQDDAPAVSDFDAYTRGQKSIAFNDRIMGEGGGAVPGDVLTVSYRGKLFSTGREFAANEKFVFELGQGMALPGFDDGLVGTKVGSKRILRVPPQLAYGAKGTSTIPGNSDLEIVCEVNGIATNPVDRVLTKIGYDRAAAATVLILLLAISPMLPI